MIYLILFFSKSETYTKNGFCINFEDVNVNCLYSYICNEFLVVFHTRGEYEPKYLFKWSSHHDSSGQVHCHSKTTSALYLQVKYLPRVLSDSFAKNLSIVLH